MLQVILVFIFIILFTKGKKSNDKENTYQEAGRLTYEHFMKATSDYEIKRFLIANYQDPKEFEGLSRLTICEIMRMKATLTGKKYTNYPF